MDLDDSGAEAFVIWQTGRRFRFPKIVGGQVKHFQIHFLIRPARTISLWDVSSASAGASLSVERKNWETRIAEFLEKPLFYRGLHAGPE